MTVWFNIEYDDADLYKVKLKIGSYEFELKSRIAESEIIDIILRFCNLLI